MGHITLFVVFLWYLPCLSPKYEFKFNILIFVIMPHLKIALDLWGPQLENELL